MSTVVVSLFEREEPELLSCDVELASVCEPEMDALTPQPPPPTEAESAASLATSVPWDLSLVTSYYGTQSKLAAGI